MRKIELLLVAAIAVVALGLPPASAERVCTNLGIGNYPNLACVGANGNTFYVDGDESNPPPARGYVTLTGPTFTLPEVCVDNMGGPGDPGATCVPFPVDGPVPVVCNELACVSLARDGFLAVVDGAPGNPDPFDGYVLVDDDGTVCENDHSGPYSLDEEYEPPTCVG